MWDGIREAFSGKWSGRHSRRRKRVEVSEAKVKHAEFRIGLEFTMGDARWRCTDVGTRTVSAIKLEAPDPSWFNGPPYAVAEHCLDEDDQEACEPVDTDCTDV